MAAIIAVRGGILWSLCFLANLVRKLLRFMSFAGRLESLDASWSSIRALAMSAQHRRKRSLSGGRLASFLRPDLVAVTVEVAMVGGRSVPGNGFFWESSLLS